MTSPRHKIWSRDQFLDLLDDEDIAALWQKWRLPPSEKMSKEAPNFAAALSARSNSSLLQEVLTLRTETLLMLRDVLTFLASHNSALRTTGGLLVLDDEFDIAPQQVNAALQWSAAALRRHSTMTWEGLKKSFDSEILPLFGKIGAFGAVRTSRKKEDSFQSIHPRVTRRLAKNPKNRHRKLRRGRTANA